MNPAFAAATGTTIVVIVIVVIIFAVVFGFYTLKGSAINAHPSDGLDGAPGSADPSEPDGRGRIAEDPDRPADGGSINTRGTR